MSKYFRNTAVVAVLCLLVQPVALLRGQQAAPPAAPATFSPAASLPFAARVTAGTLPNGVRYYLRKNGRAEKRVPRQLGVQAGSIDETAAQQGLAHFLEHMGFNGSTHF